MSRLLLPDRLWCDGAWQRGVGVAVGDDERIGAVRKPSAGDDVERLPGRALAPGFVNAHSHAFQRAIRGHTQQRAAEAALAHDDFWAWRDRMYGVVVGLDGEGLEAVSAMAYLEMLESGWTSVAEFHYLHHLGDPAASDGMEGSRRVVAAAALAGIRQTLVRVAYLRGGFERALSPGQLHFHERCEDYLERCLALRDTLPDGGRRSWGVAAHSVRAVGREELGRVADLARRQNRPFHIHVSEQPREVEECLAEHGMRPLQLLDSIGALSERTVLVHGNHFDADERVAAARSGATICICPTTEGDLGDGMSPGGLDPGRPAPVAGEMRSHGGRICLGTDSQTVIDPFAETRALEHLERMAWGKRLRLDVEAELLPSATEWGAAAMGAEVGRIAPGCHADLVAIDLRHDTLLGVGDVGLWAAILLSGSAALVSDVWVAGERLVTGGHHHRRDEIRERFVAAVQRLS